MNRLRIAAIGHSYVVASNRSALERIARNPQFEVTVIAPQFFQGDLRPIQAEVTERASYKLVTLPVRLTRFSHFFFYQDLKAALTAQPFDLLQIWEEPFIVSGYQIARLATRLGLPYFFISCQNLPKQYPPPFNYFERYAIRNATGWLGCGRLVKEALLKRGYPERNFSVMPFPVDEEIFFPDSSAGKAIKKELGLEGPVIGFVGRLTREKGVKILMAALEKIPPPWTLLVLGSGEYETALAQWAKERGISNRVKILLAPHGKVAQYMRAMDLLVVPSLTTPQWKEQYGRVLVEAFACKVSVVGSDSGEIPHVLQGAGIGVPELDVNAWAQAIGKLLDSPQLREKLGEAGNELYHREYSASAVANKYISYYQQLLGKI